MFAIYSDYEIKLPMGDYKAREYCVQYGETAAAFIRRLLSEEGIAYFFRHEKGRHTMVLTDSVYQHKSGGAIEYHDAKNARLVPENIFSWQVRKKSLATQYAHTDYNFQEANVSLLARNSVTRKHGSLGLEQFRYPSMLDVCEKKDGSKRAKARTDALAKLRMEEIQAVHEIAIARTTCRSVFIGEKITLAKHPRADFNQEYLVTRVMLSFDAGEITNSNNNEVKFECEFFSLRTDLQYRPVRLSKPTVKGPQSAIVTGAPSSLQRIVDKVLGAHTVIVGTPVADKVHTDEYGRVKVQFPWDRRGAGDANASCWIRVAQVWAGSGWGSMHIPRVGQEVIVEYLDGDPDRPIITGRVYNNLNMPPYKLPGEKYVSGLRSNSTLAGKDGSAAENFNEVKMDDTQGRELLAIQAEKDRTVLVKNDNTETIKHDEAITVGNDRSKHVVNDETTDIDGNRTETVKKNETITIKGNRTELVNKNEDITINANRTEQVAKDEKLNIGKNRTHEIGEKDILTVGKELFIDVGDQITIKTGDASIIMKKDGTIQIKGKDISILASGKISTKSDKDTINKGKNLKGN
jgi:type VI secretion system secreted protein VgrG